MTTETDATPPPPAPPRDVLEWVCFIRGTLPEGTDIRFGARATCYGVRSVTESGATARAGAAAAGFFKSGRFAVDDGSAKNIETAGFAPVPSPEDQDALPAHDVEIVLGNRSLQATAVITAYQVRAPNLLTAIAIASAQLGKQLAKLDDITFMRASALQVGGALQPQLFDGSAAPRPADVDAHGVVDESRAPAPAAADGGAGSSLAERVMDHVANNLPALEKKLNRKMAHGGVSRVSLSVTGRPKSAAAKKGARR